MTVWTVQAFLRAPEKSLAPYEWLQRGHRLRRDAVAHYDELLERAQARPSDFGTQNVTLRRHDVADLSKADLVAALLSEPKRLEAPAWASRTVRERHWMEPKPPEQP